MQDDPISNELDALRSLIMSLEARVSKVDAQVEAMDDDIGEADVPIVQWGDGDVASPYASYFRVIDASTADPAACKIGVTSGGNTVSGICGTVKINGERVDVTAMDETLSSDGVYYVWIHSWIDAVNGEQAEIVFGAVDDDVAPDNPNAGLLFASQLAGRVTVDGGAIASITQDYLRGGEHAELLYSADCDGGA